MLDISLTIAQDFDILRNSFINAVTTMQQRGLPVTLHENQVNHTTNFRFILELNTEENHFLLPMTLASLISQYLIDHREKAMAEDIIATSYCFLDKKITEKAVYSLLTTENIQTKEHRQKLIFFPLINYFSKHLPSVKCNIEGFIKFRLEIYYSALKEDLLTAIDEILWEEEVLEYQKMA
ncbi:MAG: sporulation protein YtxC, partial [Clostridiales bacterium]